MRSRQERDLVEWLEAEREGQADAADRCFRAALGAVPRRVPGVGFAGRVLVAAGIQPACAPASAVWASQWMAVFVTTALVLTGIALATLSWGDALEASLGLVQTLAIGLARTWAWAGSLATASWSAWQILVQIGGALSMSMAVPGAAGFLAVNLLTAAGALMALRRLLAQQEG